MMKKFRFSLLCFIACLLATTARADTVVLHSGGVISDCKVVRKSERLVEVRTPSGRMSIPREVVKKIKRGKSVFDTYEKKRSRIKKRDHRKLFKLATWCSKTPGLRREMLELAERVIALKANHSGARRMLGYFRKGEKWAKLPPLALNVEVSNGAKEISPWIPDRVSKSISERSDFEMNWEEPEGSSIHSCTVAVSAKSRKKGAALFFGPKVSDGQTVVLVKLVARAKWLGRKGISVTIEGEVPGDIPNSEELAVQDAFTRNATKVTRFLDRIQRKRTKSLEVTKARAQAVKNGVSKKKRS